MSDPERLFKGRGTDPEVAQLVQSLRGIAPDANRGLGSWASMAEKIAALPLAAVPNPSAAPGAVNPPAPAAPLPAPVSLPPAAPLVASASKLFALKLTALALASAVAGVVFWRTSAVPQRSIAPASTASAPAPRVALVALPLAAETAGASSGAIRVPVSAREMPLGAPAVSAALPIRSSALEAEASLLAKMRAELRSGQARAALSTLNQLQSTFPHGALLQEREVLAVEVLAATGNLAAAKRKANAFIAAHPASPHNAKLERLVEAR